MSFDITASKIKTAYFDLISLKRFLLRCKNTDVFNSTISFTVLRDSCLIIFEIHQNIFSNTEHLQSEIKEIRNGIKLYRKRGNNKIFEQIIQQHILEYKDYTDNVGFYLNENDDILGSTIYSEYLLRRIQHLKDYNELDKPRIFELSIIIGTYIQSLITLFESNYPNITHLLTSESDFYLPDQTEVVCKDVNHLKLFSDREEENVFKYRTILILQETFAIKWTLENYYLNISNKDEIDKYFLYRFTLIKFDSIIDALINLKDFYPLQFALLVEQCNGRLMNLFTNYMNNDFSAVAELRNTIHYDDEKNFYDYFLQIEDYIDLKQIFHLNGEIYFAINSYLDVANISQTPWDELLNEGLKNGGL